MPANHIYERNLPYLYQWGYISVWQLNNSCHVNIIAGVITIHELNNDYCINIVAGMNFVMNHAPDWSYARGMVHNKIHHIHPGCLRPSIALTVQNRGLKHQSLFHWLLGLLQHISWTIVAALTSLLGLIIIQELNNNCCFNIVAGITKQKTEK